MSLLTNAARSAALCCSVFLAGGYVYLQAGGELPSFSSATQANDAQNPALAQAMQHANGQQRAVLIGGSKSRVPLIPNNAGGQATPLQPYLPAGFPHSSNGQKFLPASKAMVISDGNYSAATVGHYPRLEQAADHDARYEFDHD